MPNNITTVKDNFPVVDITHKPKRLQRDNLRSQQSEDSAVSLAGKESDVPSIVTLERAIKFYESHADGEYKNLYLQTAKWLREFMNKTVPVPSGVDIDKAQELLDKVRGNQ